MAEVKISRWGNSNAIRIPQDMLNQLDFHANDVVSLEVIEDKIVVRKAHKNQSIHDLFKNYKGGSFKSDLVEFEPVGNEEW